jgi:hypothetical protein
MAELVSSGEVNREMGTTKKSKLHLLQMGEEMWRVLLSILKRSLVFLGAGSMAA